jgi:hypothetical protein
MMLHHAVVLTCSYGFTVMVPKILGCVLLAVYRQETPLHQNDCIDHKGDPFDRWYLFSTANTIPDCEEAAASTEMSGWFFHATLETLGSRGGVSRVYVKSCIALPI